jgi:hypothetical protein
LEMKKTLLNMMTRSEEYKLPKEPRLQDWFSRKDGDGLFQFIPLSLIQPE